MALTLRYVSVAGGGTHDGTSEANAFTWAEMITDLNTPRAGYKYAVKSGTYANGTTATTLTGDGTATSPNVIEGYAITPGDLVANGRDSNGALITTGYPAISYTGTTARLNASGSSNLIIRCLDITAAASAATVSIAGSNVIERCKVTTTSTHSSAVAIQSQGGNAKISDNDAETAATGSLAAVLASTSSALICGNRVKCIPGSGIRSGVVGGLIIGNVIYESAIGIAITGSTAECKILNNTIVNCTGDGIDIVGTLAEVIMIAGNHITGNGGYGIDFNGATCQKILGYNRFRDNTSGPVSGGGDWEEGTSVNNVTSDDSDATDFTNQANDNYSLLTTAAAITAGIGFRNPIGAHGAGSFGSGGGLVAPIISATGGLIIR